MKRNINHIQGTQESGALKKQNLVQQQENEEEDSLFLKLFDESIIQNIFIKLFDIYDSKKKEKHTFFIINDNFIPVCKLFYKISKQNLFKFNFNNINLNIPYHQYLRLKYITTKLNTSNIDELLLEICEYGFYNLIDILIENNANVNYANTYLYRSILMKATLNNNIKTVKQLLKYKNLDINYQDDDGYTALILACENCFLDIVSLLIVKETINLNLQNKVQDTALMRCCYEADIVSLLISKENINLNLQDNFGGTALMKASFRGYLDIISLLISKENINLNLQNNDGYTALMRVCLRENKDIVSLLISKENINLNLQDNFGGTALMKASFRGYLDIISLLISKENINLNLQNKYGDTALMMSCYEDHENIVSLLISNKNIDLSLVNNNNETALDIAKQKGFQNIVQILDKKQNN